MVPARLARKPPGTIRSPLLREKACSFAQTPRAALSSRTSASSAATVPRSDSSSARTEATSATQPGSARAAESSCRAEAALLDSLFLADQLALAEDVGQVPRAWLEPVTVLAAIAVATSRIGMIATASTTYTEPFNLARQFASQHL